MKTKIFILLIIQSLSCKIYAQSYYMHEAAEDSDGNPIGGILGLLILIGIGIVIEKLWGNGNKQNNMDNNSEYDKYCHHDIEKDETLDKSQFGENVLEKNTNNTLKNIENLPSKTKDIKQSFSNKIIKIYGDQTERFGGLLIIKEDNEYHYLSIGDERYKILDEYLLKNKPNNCTDTIIKVDWNMIRLYQLLHKNDFPPFNPIEKANIEKNDFLGGKLLALNSYYQETMCCFPHPVSRLEFFLSIGFDETILLHKIIKHPMIATDWRDLKVMQLKGFQTYEEYKTYRNKAGLWYEDDKGWNDEFYGYLAPTYDEARKVYDKKEGYTLQEAYKEIKSIKWEI